MLAYHNGDYIVEQSLRGITTWYTVLKIAFPYNEFIYETIDMEEAVRKCDEESIKNVGEQKEE